MDRNEKSDWVSAMADIFQANQMGLLVDYRGLDVSQVTELRTKLHEKQVGMKVLKNRLAKIAIEGTPFEPLKDSLSEPRALIFGQDPVAPAKVVADFIKDNDKLAYISGYMISGTGGSILDFNQLKQLGSLPSREELLAKLMGVMNAVPGKFVRTLNEVPSKFVRVLAAVRDAKGNEG